MSESEEAPDKRVAYVWCPGEWMRVVATLKLARPEKKKRPMRAADALRAEEWSILLQIQKERDGTR